MGSTQPPGRALTLPAPRPPAPKPADYSTGSLGNPRFPALRAVAAAPLPRPLPRRLLDDPGGQPHNEPVPPAVEHAVTRVLIVDDDVSVTDTFSRMLRLEGHEVWAALSADEGLMLAQAHRPHAVILDLRMPLTSGLQFLRAVRAIPGLARTPVAIVTGDYYLDDDQAAEIRALDAEVRFKPLWLEELVTLARDLIRQPVPE
ncbi:MAG: response regulator [Acidimicrobiia bacterium]|nr:response regulator [Acidimicrobiia bacterium]